MKKTLSLTLILIVGAVFAQAQNMLPPNAQAGECYARVFIPPVTQTATERVVKTEATSRIEITPARFETVTERVVTKEASYRLEAVPAQYENRTERILVKPAYTTWKSGGNPLGGSTTLASSTSGVVGPNGETTGEVMCLVEVPAEYKTVTTRVMTEPPSTRRIDIPAEYGSVQITKMVTPPQERRIDIPAEYETVTKEEVVSEGKMSWTTVLCNVNARPTIVRALQTALKNAGHYSGPIDGILGNQTYRGVTNFQRARNLAEGGITFETLQALGVSM